MKLKPIALLVVTALLACLSTMPSASAMPSANAMSPASASALEPEVFDASLWLHPGPADDEAEMAVVVELEGPTAFDLFAATSDVARLPAPRSGSSVRAPEELAAEQALLQRAFGTVAARQEPARGFLERAGTRIVSTYDSAANGFLVLVDRSRLESLALTPGVKRIYRAPEHYPTLGDAVPFIGAVAAAEELGYTGKGVTIAIVDSGIDYTHKSFGGGGKQRDYTDNNPRTIEMRNFPTEKVVGGYDFAGSQYNPSAGIREPSPDPDPLDEMAVGHGTHVAGIAAGAEGNSRVHHGVAREAYLIGLKVFGRQGSTNLAMDAIEWAIEANMSGEAPKGLCSLPEGGCRVDVLNMSLGSPWAMDVQEALGVIDRATQAGIVVVASAGNSGDTPFIHGSPAASPLAVSVANSYPPGAKNDAIEVTHGEEAEVIEAVQADASLAQQISEERDGELEAELAWFGRGCDGDSPVSDTRERVALIQRGLCSFKEKLENAYAQRAIGVVLIDDGSGLSRWAAQPADPVDLPAYLIEQAEGLEIAGWLQSGDSVRVRMAESLNGTFERYYLADVISPSSSRGPTRSGGFKPDISAPGTGIVAPRRGSGDRGRSLSGTSMSSPMVAGAAAVVIERLRSEGLAPVETLDDPSRLVAADVGALLMNYASATVWRTDSRTDDPAPLARQGAGRVDVLGSVSGTTLLRAGPIASLSFGFQAITDDFSDERVVTISNLSSEAKQYTLRCEMVMADDEGVGISYTPSESEIVIDGGESVDASVRLDIEADQMKPFTGYGGGLSMSEEQIADAEADAYLIVSESGSGASSEGGDVARLPLYLHARAASLASAWPDPLRISPTSNQGDFTIGNRGAGLGWAELYALLGQDPLESRVHPSLDVDFVGVRSTQGDAGERLVEFLVHTSGARLMPLESSLWILVDSDTDGSMDYAISNYDRDFYASGGARVGGQQILLRRVTSNDPLQFASELALLPYWAGMDLDSRTIRLPVPAQLLGYGPTDPIQLAVVVRHAGTFRDSHGGALYQLQDVVPDDGFSESGEKLAVGTGRLELDLSQLGYELDRWHVELRGGESRDLTISRTDGADPIGSQVLVSYPANPPDDTDLQVMEIAEGEPPSGTPTPTPTATATPRPKGMLYVPLILRRHAIEESSPTPSADATATPDATRTPDATSPVADTPTAETTPPQSTEPATPLASTRTQPPP